MNNNPHRNQLQPNQVNILQALYKFRFITASFLSLYKNVSHVAVHKSLKILIDQEYVGSHHDKSYKLLGKGARYYLAPKGLKYLKDNFELNEQVLHAMYKNKSVTEGFIDHHIATCNAYLYLSGAYPHVFDIYAKTETAGFDGFPDPRPDLFLNRQKPSHVKMNQYFIELHHDKPPINARKRLAELIEHYDEGEWDSDIYPTLCFVLADARAEDGFVEHAKKVLDSTGMDDEVTILTTSIKALGGTEKAIWTNVLTPEKLTGLQLLLS